MENLYKIKEALWKELEKSETARSGELKGGELEAIHKLTDTIKNIDMICMLEEESGYIEAVDGDDYGHGSSYANRGKHYVRGNYSCDGGRDGMGGYSSRRDNRGRYSRDDGRSEMMRHIEAALDSANEQDREAIKRLMRQMENA